MDSVVRKHVGAGVALAVAGAIAVTSPAPAEPPATHTANLEARLAASVANIPANLAYAIANVPYYEVQAINRLAGSFFFTGTWFVASATNIWGTDPADPGHYEALTNLAIPFPAIADTLGHQLSMIAAAELPASSSCDAEGCFPLIPVDPVTGITQLDTSIQIALALTGLRPLPLIANWLKVPLSELLTGYTFPEVADPSGTVYDGFGYQGTHVDPATGEPLLPWSGTTFTWNPLAPVQNFYDSLTATPPPAAEAIHPVTGDEVIRAVQALLAGAVVDFYPVVPGSSPTCSTECALPANPTVPAIVKTIGDAYPGNPLIEEWQAATAGGTANGPTAEQSAIAVRLNSTGVFTLNKATATRVNALLTGINPVLPRIAAHSGLLGPSDGPALQHDLDELLGSLGSRTTDSTDRRAAQLAAPTSQLAAPTSIPSVTPDSESIDVHVTPIKSQPPKNVSTQVRHDTPSLRGATTGARTRPLDRLTRDSTATGTTRDGNMAAPRRVGVNGTTARHPLADALKSAGDQINSGISKIARGLSGDNKAGATGGGDPAE
jgi:hypothetical protein